jgi:hypothetical protein
MGFERLAPQPSANLEVTSGQDLLCKQKGCTEPATGYVTMTFEGPNNDEKFQLRVPIRVPMCDEHRGAVEGERDAHPSAGAGSERD